jgi:hypothetical protein
MTGFDVHNHAVGQMPPLTHQSFQIGAIGVHRHDPAAAEF